MSIIDNGKDVIDQMEMSNVEINGQRVCGSADADSLPQTGGGCETTEFKVRKPDSEKSSPVHFDEYTGYMNHDRARFRHRNKPARSLIAVQAYLMEEYMAVTAEIDRHERMAAVRRGSNG